MAQEIVNADHAHSIAAASCRHPRFEVCGVQEGVGLLITCLACRDTVSFRRILNEVGKVVIVRRKPCLRT